MSKRVIDLTDDNDQRKKKQQPDTSSDAALARALAAGTPQTPTTRGDSALARQLARPTPRPPRPPRPDTSGDAELARRLAGRGPAPRPPRPQRPDTSGDAALARRLSGRGPAPPPARPRAAPAFRPRWAPPPRTSGPPRLAHPSWAPRSAVCARSWTFDADAARWIPRDNVWVSITDEINRGAMRTAFRMSEFQPSSRRGGSYTESVAKRFHAGAGINARQQRDAHFNEAATQMIAEGFARMYNAEPAVASNKRANKIAFASASVLEMPGGQFANAEFLMPGNYVKHNNNDGAVASRREVPQAFSHFTLERSRGALIVVDIQGVGDFFTDPQIHTRVGDGRTHYGLGNLGAEGIRKFCASHRCNAVCRALRLKRLK